MAAYSYWGTFLWADQFGVIPTGIAVDSSGDVYVAGTYTASTSIGSTDLAVSGSQDGFVCQINSSTGSPVWAKRAYGSGDGTITPENVAVDGSGDVYVGGEFMSSSANFGGTTLTPTGTESFIWKLTASSGASDWAISASNSEVTGITTDASGDVIASGSYAGGSATFGGTTLSAVGSMDTFVWKLYESGTTDWAVMAGGSSTDTEPAGCAGRRQFRKHLSRRNDWCLYHCRCVYLQWHYDHAFRVRSRLGLEVECLGRLHGLGGSGGWIGRLYPVGRGDCNFNRLCLHGGSARRRCELWRNQSQLRRGSHRRGMANQPLQRKHDIGDHHE